ncbi:hypothetical protein MFMK1_000405 [Metallumcola ferriviriculae]|uniref:Uncharacterized protein n=1 Tax=Metallumcola ferriviriculae TaxID=3039180 RepID=A0AAU0UJD5_9FIRM|nr:hypothetical protein MFMK1_000405 [Desulfitibacteraceae bacterium MK1]
MAGEKPASLMQTYYKPETEHQEHASTFMAWLIFSGLLLFVFILLYQFG